MTALTQSLIEEIKTAPESVQREVLDFLAFLKARDLPTGGPNDLIQERADWVRLSAQGIARAYGPDEPEYTLDMVRTRNPSYEER